MLSTEQKIQKIIDELKARTISPSVPTVDERFDNLYTPSTILYGKWYRNYKGEYYKYNDQGVAQLTKVPADFNNCFGLDITDGAKCRIFMKIITNPTEEPSKEAIKEILAENAATNDYFKEISNKINDLHPKIALAILRKFGFKMDKNNKQIVPVSYWLSKLAEDYFKNSDPASTFNFDAMLRKQEGLLKFLNLLVHYINANPGILNKEHVASTADLQDYIKSVFKSTGIQTNQEPYFITMKEGQTPESVYPIYPVMAGGANKRRVSKPLNKEFLRHLIKNAAVFSTVNIQGGGNPYVYETNTSDLIRKSISDKLVNYYNYIKKIALLKNVTIDDMYMNELLDKLAVYEKKVLGALATIQKFTENNKNFGEDNAVSLVAMEDYLDTLVKYSQGSQELEQKVIKGINDIAGQIHNDDIISQRSSVINDQDMN
jgi:hypothetical protein